MKILIYTKKLAILLIKLPFVENIFTKGTKFESIYIREYENNLDKIKEDIINAAPLSDNNKNYFLQKIEEIKKNMNQMSIGKVLNEIKEKAMSMPEKVIVSLIVKQIVDVFTK